MNSNAPLLLSLIFFAGIFLCVCVYAIRIKKARITDPILQFLFFFCLFVLPLPIRAYKMLDIEGDVTEHLPQLLPYIPEAVFLCAIGLVFFTAAYYSRTARRIALHIPQIQSGTNWRRAFVGIGCLSLLLVSLLARSTGGLLDFILLGYEATSETVGKGYLAIGFPGLFLACMLLLYGYAMERKRTQLFLFYVFFALVIAMHLVMARRGQILYWGLAVWLFWHHAVRPIRMRTLLIIGVVSFIGLNFVGMVRSSSYESFENFWARSSKTWQSSDSQGSGLFYTLTIGEFVVPFETFPQMIESVGARINPEFGMTYVRAPLQYIPQTLFSSRPLPLANWYIQTFYGGGWDFNEARQFFFLAEGYLNFGVLGVMATMIVWGLLLGTAQNYVQCSRGQPAALLLHSCAMAYICFGIAGESVSLLVGLPELSLCMASLGLWMAGCKLRRNLSKTTAIQNA